MNTAQREQLKDNLRAMIAGRSDGIVLDTPFNWIVEGIKQPDPFFEPDIIASTRCHPLF